jgi:hypothetical protein
MISRGSDDGVRTFSRSEASLVCVIRGRGKGVPPDQGAVPWIHSTNDVLVGECIEKRGFGAGIRLLEQGGIAFRKADEGVVVINVICVVGEDGSGSWRETCCQGE